MTSKQREVLDQISNLLTEHFDGHCYIVDIADEDDEGSHQTLGGYAGGIAMALGLCEYQITYLRHKIVTPQEGGE